MDIDYDPAKRELTLQHRGLDFVRATDVFAAEWLVKKDDRMDYGEVRFISYGELDGRAVVLVWTPRGAVRRIISMRYANEREREFASHAFKHGLG